VPVPTPGRFTRRQLAIALSTGVAAAAVAVTLVATLGGGSHKPASHRGTSSASASHPRGRPHGSGGGGLITPSQSCQQNPSGCSPTTTIPTATGPSADWLGMQIVTSPSGVVVNTVRLGSPADQAGFEPGDQIMSVDTHVIGAVSELRSDTSGLKIGSPVTIAVLRSSVRLTFASMRMTQHPIIHP
jgi:membrane-associated protease RseP (regulator of RpoE activity)